MPGQTHRGWRPCAVKIIPLEYYIMNQNPSIRKLVRCGVVAAIYVVLCMALQPFSYGAVQVRVAEALCLLPVFGAEYIAGVVLGCFLANLLGSTIVDVIFGTLATLLACLVTYKLRNIRFKGLAVAASLPPVLFNAVIIGIEIAVMFPDPTASAPIWLACITNGISVGIGELISCTVLGVLLVKIIDAKRDLSVQVHPDDTLAKARHNSYGKTEMWYIIKADEGAPIYAGLSKQITPEQYEKCVAENTIMDVIARHDSHAGDLFFLPAGRIHAIGAGNLLAEIQQTSDITYRVYDFGRLDANGNPRELHTEQAKDAIDYTVYPEYKSNYDRNGKSATPLVKCEYFDVKREIIEGESTIDASADSFMIVMCLDGAATITDNLGGVTEVKKGESILVPAVITSMKAEGNATFMTATV